MQYMSADLSKMKARMEQENSNLRVRYGDLEDSWVLTNTIGEKAFREYFSSPEFALLTQGLVG